MLPKCLIFIFSFLFTISSFAQGQGTGNGGGVVICKDPQTEKDRSVELADLYEGRNTYSLTYQWMQKYNVEAIRNIVFYRMYDRFGYRFMKEYLKTRDFMRLHFFKVKDIQIYQTPDVKHELIDHIQLEPGCRVEQVVNYIDNFGIVFSSHFFNEMKTTITDFEVLMSALFDHECVYAAARRLAGDVNSQRTRAMIAVLYSDQYLDRKYKKWLDKEYKRMKSKKPADIEGLKKLKPKLVTQNLP